VTQLPTEYVGAISDQDTDLIKSFRFTHVKWFPKGGQFVLGYNKAQNY
jgi:hypothetical protein